jgi:capsular polysaccharide biosynthesis protein
MRDVFVQACGQPAVQGPERIFLSRGGLPKDRRLVNEEALLPAIRRLGFTIIRPESLSFKEQICTFQNARVVLGAFGAGLTNCMFCPPGSRVLELEDPVFAPRYWYWKLASILGHEWRCYVGQSRDKRTLTWADWPSAKFSVNEEGLVEFLESALKNNGQPPDRQWWIQDVPSAFPCN